MATAGLDECRLCGRVTTGRRTRPRPHTPVWHVGSQASLPRDRWEPVVELASSGSVKLSTACKAARRCSAAPSAPSARTPRTSYRGPATILDIGSSIALPGTTPQQAEARNRSPVSRRRADVVRLRDLTLHLAKRELDATHRMTVLGWAWPLVRQLAQLAVLVFIFSKVLDLGIDNYPVFVFTGLIAWTWFAGGITSASSSLLAQRHLLFQARFPAVVLPVVALAVPLLDVLLALPLLLVLVAATEGLPWTVVLVPMLLAVQFVFMAGLAWIASAMSVFFRDVPNLVGLALMLLFYLTPIFYGLRNLPGRFRELLQINPLTTIVETYRALLLGDPLPGTGHLVAVCVLSVVVAVVGFAVFQRVQGRFVDQL